MADKPFAEKKKQIKRYKKFKRKLNEVDAVKLTDVNMHNYSYREKIVHDEEKNTLTFVFYDLVLKEGDYVIKADGKREPILKIDFEEKYGVESV